MMMTTRAILALLLGLGAIAGCEATQADEQKKATAAQAEADMKGAKAQEEAHQKATQAQVDANQKERDVNTTLIKRRADFQVSAQKQLDGLDKKVDDLKLKTTTAASPAKGLAELALRAVADRRNEVSNDMGRIQSIGGDEWDAFKTGADAHMADLEKSIDAVKL